MDVQLTPELESFVQQKVESGRYRDSDEVVAAALKLADLRDRTRDARRQHRDHLRRALEEGTAQAERGELIDGRQVFDDARRRIRGEDDDPDLTPR